MSNLTSKLLILLLCLLSSSAKSYSEYKCEECYQAQGGQWCLQDDRLSEGTCCNDGLPDEQKTQACKTQSSNQFCVKKGVIDNDILAGFACPAQSGLCPTTDVVVEIEEADKEYRREHTWSGRKIPDEAASGWNCKYVVRAARSLVNQAAPGDRGYIMLQVEQYGFDEEVFLIVQAHGKYRDFSFTNPDPATKIYGVRFSERFFVPAEHDLLLSFEPVRRDNGAVSQAGRLQLRTWLQRTLSEDDLLAANTRVLRRPQSGEKAPETPEKESEDGGFIASDDSGKEKVNWDGQAVPDGPWLEQALFKVNDTPITNEDVVVSSVILVIVIIIIAVICCGCSWWKRKALAESVRRASTYVMRASQRLRRSIRATLGRRPEEPLPDGPAPSPSALGRNKQEVAFVRDLFDHQGGGDSARPLQRGESEDVEASGSPTDRPGREASAQKDGSVMRKQKTFLVDLATHQRTGGAEEGAREMSFGKGPGARTVKARKTVTFVDVDDMEFEEGQNYGDDERKKSMDKFFAVAAAGPEKLRGLTVIKNLLVDFENDSDFVVSQAAEPGRSSDMLSVQTGAVQVKPNQEMRRGTVHSANVSGQASPNTAAKEEPDRGAATKDVADLMALIEQSKNLLYDLKVLEERNDSHARKLDEDASGSQGENQRGSPEFAGEDAPGLKDAKKYVSVTEIQPAIADEGSPRQPAKQAPPSSARPSEMALGSVLDLLDDNDADFRHFLQRKATIMSNISHLAAQKYHDDQAKQRDLVSQVAAALDEEEAQYRLARQTIKRSLRRQTLQRPDLTPEQRELLQRKDLEYKLFPISDSQVSSSAPEAHRDLDHKWVQN